MLDVPESPESKLLTLMMLKLTVFCAMVQPACAASCTVRLVAATASAGLTSADFFRNRDHAAVSPP
jgi:hypothetical protein